MLFFVDLLRHAVVVPTSFYKETLAVAMYLIQVYIPSGLRNRMLYAVTRKWIAGGVRQTRDMKNQSARPSSPSATTTECDQVIGETSKVAIQARISQFRKSAHLKTKPVVKIFNPTIHRTIASPINLNPPIHCPHFAPIEL